MVADLVIFLAAMYLQCTVSDGDQPLSKIAIHKSILALHNDAFVKVSVSLLGFEGINREWVFVEFSHPKPTIDDWIGVFSPANFSSSTCFAENPRVYPPLLCTAPKKFQYAISNSKYVHTGNESLKLQLINQRADFTVALLTGGLLNPKLTAISNVVSFANSKAPIYPHLAQVLQVHQQVLWDGVILAIYTPVS